MNLERLEMMRVMMERVIAGSWEPDQSILSEVHRPTNLPLEVGKVNLYNWRAPTEQTNVCGFSACAVGHAAFDREFRKLGWRWVGGAPYFGNDGGWVAVYKFFEIRSTVGDMLFMSTKYKDSVRAQYRHLPMATREAKMVADRIEFLIQNGQDKFEQKYGF
ncbi:hypothetical protein D3C71_1146580 [compost metagenome]